jgi:hypothetical protein
VHQEGDYRDVYTAHCLRVGCATTLFKLGLDKERIMLWCGWDPSGGTWAKYIR